jgi:quercetin dioxygenase-like cupin family protein
MRNRILLFAAVCGGLVAVGEAGGQEVARAPEPAAHVAQERLEWVEIIPGADFAAVYGQWTEGPHAKFARFAPGMAVPLHRHTNEYHGVVVQGEFTNPFPGQQAVVMRPGDYWRVPARMAHSNECVSNEPCLIFTYGDAPWDVEMVAD